MSQRLKRQSPPVIPDELIHEILLRFPAKSLLRFKCVCKSWKALISHPQFANDHLHTSTSGPIMNHQRLVLMLHFSNKAIIACSMNSFFVNPPTPIENHTFRMDGKHLFIGSINGLFCLRDHNDRFKLWNPCTGSKSRSSPREAMMIIRRKHDALFGYDEVNNKYKVLVLGVHKTVAMVYTFGERHWTTIRDLPCPKRGMCPALGSGRLFWLIDRHYGSSSKCPTFVSGNLHWLAVSDDDSSKLVIISFDVEKETYKEMLLPPRLKGYVELHASNNCLYVCQDLGRNSALIMWLMKEYGVHESWTELMTISYENFRTFHICDYWVSLRFRPLCILKNGVVLLRAECSCQDSLVLYDSNNGTFANFMTKESQYIWRTGIYHPSLVSPP